MARHEDTVDQPGADTPLPSADELEQLRASEQRYRLLADHVNDVVWTMALDGTITSVSPAVERVRGLTSAEAMVQPPEEILTPSSLAITMAYLEQAYASIERGEVPEGFHGELEYYHRDGSVVCFDVQVLPHTDADGQVIELLGVSRDISHHKRHAQELADRARDLEDFASVVAHDLRGPLATIRMLLETAMRADVTTTSVAPQELLERAVHQADRARTTIEALLTLARARQQQLQLSTVALRAVAMEVVDDLAVAVEQQGARIEVAALPEVTGDPALLRVVLQNLISNALRYRHPDRPPVITVTGSRREDRVTVEVADNGLGIAPEDLDRIFTPDHRSASRTGEGLGLGLVTARRIVTRLGGTIEAHPEQLGTRFVVTLPAAA